MGKHYYFVDVDHPYAWARVKDMWEATADIHVTIRDNDDIYYHWTLHKGFRTDGGSVPGALQWFVPSWSENNHIINIAYALHDAAYGTEYMTRADADDMLRGLLRDAGLSRFRASTVCVAVKQFACCHYGIVHDDNDSILYVELEKGTANVSPKCCTILT